MPYQHDTHNKYDFGIKIDPEELPRAILFLPTVIKCCRYEKPNTILLDTKGNSIKRLVVSYDKTI